MIIDGHNLIPKIKGLDLGDPDDERQLIELLQGYCRVQRKTVEVFFDNAPPGQARSQKYGQVTAYFVRREITADDAIRRRLSQLRRTAQNWTVVSSDLQVMSAAHRAGAKVISSEQFARQLAQTQFSGGETLEEPRDRELDDQEIENWLGIFGGETDE